jgi:hypothetical protein
MRTFGILLVLLLPSVSWAAPTLTGVFPVGGQRGTSFTITASGTFEKWPVKVWVSSPFLKIEPGKAKGELLVKSDAKTPPGVYWLRLYDDSGASELRPILLGLFADQLEVEPNDETNTAQPVAGPKCIHGKLNKSGDVDCFSVTAKRGETLVASLDAHHLLKSPIDAILQIVSPAGQVLAENHDHRGLDPQLAFKVPADGTYIVRVFAFPAMPDSSIRHFGSDASVYRISITTGPWVEWVSPLVAPENGKPYQLRGFNLAEVKTTSQQVPFWNTPLQLAKQTSPAFESDKLPKTPLQPPFSITGCLNEPSWKSEFVAEKGIPLTVKVVSASWGFALHPLLTIHDQKGQQLSKADPAKLNADGELTFTPPASGLFTVKLRDLANRKGANFVYLLSVTPARPQLSATVANDRLSLTSGQPLDVTITLNRERFTDDVDFQFHGLPEKVQVKKQAPAGKADPKSLVLRLESSTTSFNGPVRLELKGQKSPEVNCVVHATVKDIGMETSQLWLTVQPPKK